MTTEELYNLLIDSDIEENLLGEILFEDNSIKYFYDGLYRSTDNMNLHLKDVYNEDIDVIKSWLKSNNIKKNSLEITRPEYDDSYLSFEINSPDDL